MAEPQPSNIQEGAAEPHAPTATAEDRRADAALSSLDAQDDAAAGQQEVSGKALDTAMKKLNINDASAEEKKSVKVEPADVNLLIKELDLSRQNATELLKSCDGDAVRAMAAFVTERA